MECITVHRIARPCVTPKNLKKIKAEENQRQYLLQKSLEIRESGRESGREEKHRRAAVFLTPSHPLHIEQRTIKKPAYAYIVKHRQTNIKGV